jgi:peroxiredoxin
MKKCLKMMAFIIYCLSSGTSALSIGDKAPDFTLTTTADSTCALSQNKGQVTLLYFFGCG